MKGSARLIGVDRQGITRHNKAGHVMQLIQNGAVGNPIGPTVYAARWSLNPLRVADNLLCKLGCCDLRFLSRFLRSLTIALGRELFDTFTVGKPSQKVERRRRRFTALIFIVGCLTHTRSVSQPLHQKSGAHTLELGLPTLTRAGQRKPGVASNSGRLCHPKLESLSSLIIHNTVSLCTFPSPIPPQKDVYVDRGHVTASSSVNIGVSRNWVAHSRRQKHVSRKAGARADIADLYQCSGDGITLHLSTVCHQM